MKVANLNNESENRAVCHLVDIKFTGGKEMLSKCREILIVGTAMKGHDSGPRQDISGN
jgi:hypothetical protein